MCVQDADLWDLMAPRRGIPSWNSHFRHRELSLSQGQRDTAEGTPGQRPEGTNRTPSRCQGRNVLRSPLHPCSQFTAGHGKGNFATDKKSQRSSKKKARTSLKSVQTLFVTARSQTAFYSLNLALLLFPYGSPRGYGFLILCIDLMSELFSGYIICLCTACQAFVMISEFMPCQSASPHTGSHTVHHLKSPNEVF